MIDHTLLVAWRAWYERNEVTHEKPIPATESSKRFLCSYVRILGSIKNTSTDQVLKGKQPMLDSGAQRINPVEVKKPPVKRWLKPPLGWVKLTIDGSFKSDDGSAGIGMVLRDYAGTVLF
jgi:hypothetical protein